MRIEVKLELAKRELPADYRRCMASMIKSAFTAYQDGSLLERFYKDTIQKDFTWSLIMNHPVFQKEKILLDGNQLTWIISAADAYNTGYHLYAALGKLKNRELPLPNHNSVMVRSLKSLPEKIIDKDSAIFHTVIGAPIVVRDHDRETNTDQYYSIKDTGFSKKLEESLKYQAKEAGFKEEEIESIKVKILEGKKVVVLNYGVYIDTTAGTLEIQAEPILLQHFYRCGISGRRSIGFGMLQLVAQRDK